VQGGKKTRHGSVGSCVCPTGREKFKKKKELRRGRGGGKGKEGRAKCFGRMVMVKNQDSSRIPRKREKRAARESPRKTRMDMLGTRSVEEEKELIDGVKQN